MKWLDLQIAAPELIILVMACVVLMLDLAVSDRRQGIIHMVALLTLAFTAIVIMRGFAGEESGPMLAFNSTFLRDGMADLLKIFAIVTLGAVYFYARHYLKEFNIYRSEFYSLTLFALLGAKVRHSDGYPGWKPNMGSELLHISKAVYRELFGSDPEVKAIHAGLECGLFLQKYPDLDMISFGPTIKGAHTPEERISIDTVDRFWKFLLVMLEKAPEEVN